MSPAPRTHIARCPQLTFPLSFIMKLHGMPCDARVTVPVKSSLCGTQAEKHGRVE